VGFGLRRIEKCETAHEFSTTERKANSTYCATRSLNARQCHERPNDHSRHAREKLHGFKTRCQVPFAGNPNDFSPEIRDLLSVACAT
jgi:hypothetical protein